MMNVSKLAPLKLLLIGAVLLLSAGRAEASDPEDIMVVANLRIKTDSIKLEDLRAMFLKERTYWPSGAQCVPINVKEDALRAEFRRRVLEMTSDEEQRYWQNQKIVQGKTPPTEFNSSLRAVFTIKGALSYVYRKDLQQNVVKVVLVIPKK